MQPSPALTPGPHQYNSVLFHLFYFHFVYLYFTFFSYHATVPCISQGEGELCLLPFILAQGELKSNAKHSCGGFIQRQVKTEGFSSENSPVFIRLSIKPRQSVYH